MRKNPVGFPHAETVDRRNTTIPQRDGLRNGADIIASVRDIPKNNESVHRFCLREKDKFGRNLYINPETDRLVVITIGISSTYDRIPALRNKTVHIFLFAEYNPCPLHRAIDIRFFVFLSFRFFLPYGRDFWSISPPHSIPDMPMKFVVKPSKTRLRCARAIHRGEWCIFLVLVDRETLTQVSQSRACNSLRIMP